MGLDLGDIVRDIAKRPFILVGTLAFLLMLPLAATSFNRAIKALGAARWQALHRLVYAIALLAILHFFWMRAGKNDFAEVVVYAAVLARAAGLAAVQGHRAALLHEARQPQRQGLKLQHDRQRRRSARRRRATRRERSASAARP